MKTLVVSILVLSLFIIVLFLTALIISKIGNLRTAEIICNISIGLTILIAMLYITLIIFIIMSVL